MNNGINPSSTPPSTPPPTGGGVKPNKTVERSAFSSRKTKTVEPELLQQGLEPDATKTVKIKDRTSAGLTKIQTLKLGLLKLGAMTLGTKANHWLANIALGLLQDSYNNQQRSVAVKLQGMIEGDLIHLDEKQSKAYAGICQSFANDDQFAEWADEDDISPLSQGRLVFDDPEENQSDKYSSITELDKAFKSSPPVTEDKSKNPLISQSETAPTSATASIEAKSQEQASSEFTFTGRMMHLYEKNQSHEALIEMEKAFIDGARRRAIKNPIDKMSKKEGITPEGIASLFNDVVHDVVTDEASQPIAEERLEQLRVMTQSMRQLYTNACDYGKTTDEIDKRLRK